MFGASDCLMSVGCVLGYCYASMLNVSLFSFFPALDANVEEEEEGAAENFEEEDQGHFANQGKPPLDAYLWILLIKLHCFIVL